MTQESVSMLEIELDKERCTGCGLCVDFCPVEVFEMVSENGRKYPSPVHLEECWACDTCVGQCPTGALRVIEPQVSPGRQRVLALEGKGDDRLQVEERLPREEAQTYKEWADILMNILGLRWNPVAITLVPAGTPMPLAPKPRVKLRYCQSLMAARRGKTLLMPVECHACPDSTHILGMTEIPPKLASGELYIKFGKLDSMEAARQMIAERPRLKPRSVQATLVSPLKRAVMSVDVVAVIAQPEQMMWLCMAASFYSGRRFEFKVSGYNAQCVETTLFPYTTKKINISLGCYGCRASSDIGDDLMFMGIPAAEMSELVRGLQALGKKAIPDSRAKIYLPPLT
jgi:uncharacterized protein (DUF169 family)/NAD-dependent dihydropyrimidine dehydrogenase PreA subunit